MVEIDPMVELKPGSTEVPQSATKREGFEAACLIVALEGARPLAPPSRHWLVKTDDVSLGRSAGDRVHGRSRERDRGLLRLRIPDEMVSAKHATLRREGNRWTITDAGSSNGTFVNGAKVKEKEVTLEDGDVIRLGRAGLVYRKAILPQPPQELDVTAVSDDPSAPPKGLRTMSIELEHEFARLRNVALANDSIVVLGESGVGKELIARAVHKLSARKGAFVDVNCGGLPKELVESELFGYRRGTFTGAITDHDGLIAASSRGTLFLDEISELPLPAQAALLRVLPEGEVRPVGSTSSTKFDLRVVCATNRDLEKLVAAEKFRSDLWSRLNGYTVRLPPLRERKEDLGLLLGSLLKDSPSRPETLTFTMLAVEALFAYNWPLNVRQLQKVTASALALAGGGPEIDEAHLRDVVRARGEPEEDERDEALRARLMALLLTHNGVISAVAKALGEERMQIYRWCKRLGIDLDEIRGKK